MNLTTAELATLRETFGPTVRSSELWNYDKDLFRRATKDGGLKKLERGVWSLDVDGVATPAPTARVAAATNVTPINVAMRRATSGDRADANNIPAKNPNFVPFGYYGTIRKIVESKKFFPVFITGESGFGKTDMVAQVCASLNRELFRVNFTTKTDEFDLIGETGLVDGDTIYQEGMVISAMKRGAVLLLDELDYASPEGFTALQSILEGKPYLIKRTGELVIPADGFTVIATANTRGQGDENGKFYGTQILNEAFLERFPITIDHAAPTPAIETKILYNVGISEGMTNVDEILEKNVARLVSWANACREAQSKGSIGVTISTRRLIHIIRTASIVEDLREAVALGVARFDKTTSEALVKFWDKISGI